MSDRIAVRRTPKLFVGGAFPRSESGRSYPVESADGTYLAHAALASRKDARDAVQVARQAQPGWAGRTAYNRGQVLYRVAEILEGRAEQFAEELDVATGGDGAAEVAATVDRLVWYAGWADKVSLVDATINPVAGSYLSWTTPGPTGVVVAFAPERPALLGLVELVAAAVVTGNTVVAVTSHAHPLPAVSLAEVMATSDVPGGVVNLLTGDRDELVERLASHRDVNALDLAGFAGQDIAPHEVAAAGAFARVLPPVPDLDWFATPGSRRMLALTEAKTVWHPVGT